MIPLISVLLVFHVFLGALVGYLIFLTIAAIRAPQQTPLPSFNPTHRFVILIPAHNEEVLVSTTLKALSKLDYPADLFSIHVVADNCTDQTAIKARECGVAVYERTDADLRGKGYALQWLLETLWENDVPHDAVCILDADSILSTNFLRVMDARLSRGERVIQAYYSVRDTGRSSTGSLRYAALAAVHYLRAQGRMMLGGSVGLKGNGMVFIADLLKQYRWSASITEDIDQHMALILNGERVTFAPDAIVWGEMPDTLANSETQIARWESGRLQMARRHITPLLKQSFLKQIKGDHQRAFILFDAAIEHLIPPFSVLVGLSIGFVFIDMLFLLLRIFVSPVYPDLLFFTQNLMIEINLAIGFGLLAGQLFYLLAGLQMVHAPGYIYQSLLSAPGFVVWKIWHYIRVLLGSSQQAWVRTPRNKN